MRLPVKSPTAAFAAVLGVFVLTADSPAAAQNRDSVHANPATSSNAGLILQESEGELRVRRPRGNSGSEGAPSFRIKVDRTYGESSSFFMGMEDIPPGKKIRLHHHPHAEEIPFVHRGTGVVRLGSRDATVRAGATVYIPKNVSIGLLNTGAEPLSLVSALFSNKCPPSWTPAVITRRPLPLIYNDSFCCRPQPTTWNATCSSSCART